MKRSVYLGALVVLALAAGWAANVVAQTAISADGMVESTTGGFQFPDGTVQTTAAVGGAPAPVEDTGQTQCFDEKGASRDCAATGEDGEHRAGVEWPTPRFTDNGDGTVTDNLTGLDWLKDANCPGAKTWQQALDWVATFNGGSPACTDYVAGTFTDWRLPNVKELASLIDYGRLFPALPSPNPFVNVQSAFESFYWSSSSVVPPEDPILAWAVDLGSGMVNTGPEGVPHGKGLDFFVWAVRDGQ